MIGDNPAGGGINYHYDDDDCDDEPDKIPTYHLGFFRWDFGCWDLFLPPLDDLLVTADNPLRRTFGLSVARKYIS